MSKDLVLLLLLTVMTVIAWAGFDLYHASTRPTLPKDVQKLTIPLDPKLDFSILESSPSATD